MEKYNLDTYTGTSLQGGNIPPHWHSCSSTVLYHTEENWEEYLRAYCFYERTYLAYKLQSFIEEVKAGTAAETMGEHY